jgi:hypothetical protein
VHLANNTDVETYKGFLAENATLPLPFVFPGGTTTHYSEIGPGARHADASDLVD